MKSLTPDTGSKGTYRAFVCAFYICFRPASLCNVRLNFTHGLLFRCFAESVSELKSMPHRLSEIQIKCSSLPPGLAAPGADETKLIRSRSNAGSKSHEILGEEEEEDRKEKADKSFLGRFFPRRSGRKKKTKDEKVNIRQSTTTDYYSSSSSRLAPVSSTYSRQTINIDSNLAIRPNALVRSGPASRQRVQPIDIPASPDLVLRREREREESLIMPKPSPEKSFAGTSPLHAELESHFRTKLTSMSKSPPISPKLSRIVPATPPKSPRSRMGTGMEESSRSKMKLPALSTLQQRVLLLKDEPDLSSNHKSLEMLETLPPKQPITKSHSFKSAKSTPEHTFITSKYRKEQVNANKVKTAEEASSAINITKSISLDSVTTIPEHTQEPKRAQNHLAKNTDVLHESKMYPITLRSIGDNKTRETSTSTSTSSSSTKTTTTNTASDETVKMTSKKETETSEQHRSVKQETVEYQRTITMDASSDSDLISKFLANAKPHSNSNSVEVSNESSVTISGPSHTAIVSVGDVNSKQTFTENVQTEVIKDDNFNKEIRIKEQQISVTKIQLKRETSSQVSMGKKNPDFLNVQLNKVETKPLSNVVLSTTPKIIDEQKKATKIASQDATKHQEALPEATKTIPQETAKTVKTTQESAKPRPQEATKARPQEVSKTTQETFKAASQEAAKTGFQETFKVAPQEASKVASLEAAKVVFQETSKVALQELSKVAFQETSKVAKVQETTKLTVQETSKVAFQEVTKTKEPTKFATPEIPKFLNQETKKEAAKQTNQDTGKKKIEQKSPVLDCKRKFSSDDIEIIENDNNLNNNNTNQNNNVSTAFVTITTMTPPVSARMFKKHSETQISQQRKSSLVCESNNKEKPILRAKSCSLEITDSAKKTSEDNSDRLVSQKSLDDLENKKKAKADKALNITDNVVLRKKMMVKQRQDDEPELMKVFARRSLKLKDNEVEELSQQVILSVEDSVNMNKSRDSDKENQSDSPSEERKFTNNIKESVKNKEETCEVNLRKPINNKINAFQKAVSLNTLINTEIITNEKLQKQSSLIERPKTDGWIMKNNDSVTIERKNEDDVISNTMENDYINEETIKPKNVNQRKAEWEKRAQEAKKKTMP